MIFGSNGTRYDESCRTCRRETEICNDCERCSKHCSCTQDAADAKQISDFHAAYPGELDALSRAPN